MDHGFHVLNCKGNVLLPSCNELNFFCVCSSHLTNGKLEALAEAVTVKCIPEHMEAVGYSGPPSPASNTPLVKPHRRGFTSLIIRFSPAITSMHLSMLSHFSAL